MKKLPHWCITDKHPALYDTESATAIEMTAKLYGAMNELISDYNKFVDGINENIDDFEKGILKDAEEFRVAMRQEFEDFIDVVELKLQSQDKEIADAIKYMKNNLEEGINKVVSDMIESGEFNDAIISSLTEITTAIDNETTARQNADNDLQTAIDNEVTERQKAILAYKVKTPEMFGAIGDGVTDDTQAFVSAITSLNNDEYLTLLLTSKYRINSNTLPRITKHGFNIIGQGNNTGFIIDSDSVDGTVFKIEAVKFNIEDFVIEGNSKGYIFDFYLSNFGVVRDLYIDNVFCFARLITDGDSTSITSLAPTFENINGSVSSCFLQYYKGHNGITINNCTINSEEENHATFITVLSNPVDTIRLQNNLIQRFDYGVAIQNNGSTIQNIFLYDNVFDSCYQSALLIASSENGITDRVFMKDCWFSCVGGDTLVNLISTNNSLSNVEIDGCTFTEPPKTGVIVSGVENVKITNCNILSHSKTADAYGILLSFVNKGVITGNYIGNDPKISQNSNIALFIDGNTNIIVTDNVMCDNKTGISQGGNLNSGIIANNILPSGETAPTL